MIVVINVLGRTYWNCLVLQMMSRHQLRCHCLASVWSNRQMDFLQLMIGWQLRFHSSLRAVVFSVNLWTCTCWMMRVALHRRDAWEWRKVLPDWCWVGLIFFGSFPSAMFFQWAKHVCHVFLSWSKDCWAVLSDGGLGPWSNRGKGPGVNW